jgi:hypothetical protein
MRTLSSVVALAGLALTPVTAMSEDLASAPNALVSDQMVFMGISDTYVPASAMETIRSAADAANSASVLIEGRADRANAVKQELIRQGAPAEAITVRPTPTRPLVQPGDGVADPTGRRVNIRFQ